MRMMLKCALCLLFLAVLWPVSQQLDDDDGAGSDPLDSSLPYKPISQEDQEFLNFLPSSRRIYSPAFKKAYVARLWGITHGDRPAVDILSLTSLYDKAVNILSLTSLVDEDPPSYPPGFKEAYLARNGDLIFGSRPAGEYLKVVGSPGASLGAVKRVGEIIHKMLRNAPPHIFANLSHHNLGMGVFLLSEKLSIFPEYDALKDTPECNGTCDGDCKTTCTGDGRKWDSLFGIGGRLAVVAEKNLMCHDDDPYKHNINIGVHEFAHTIDWFGIDPTTKQKKRDAYSYARENSLWNTSSYAMGNSAEYFAEGTGSFFLTDVHRSAGGMNECYGARRYCRTEMEAREHIRQGDPKLYEVLVKVYTNNRPQLSSGLSVCPSS